MAEHDLAIIGAGSAGLSLAGLALALGRKVVLFERASPGGARLHSGLALESLAALARQAAQAGALPGLPQQRPMLDWSGFQSGWRAGAARRNPPLPLGESLTLVRASAHFTAADRIEAAGRIYPFHQAVIAAGSTPVVPDLPGLSVLPWLTTETLFDLPAPPAHLLILGGTAEALALAQAFVRLGSAVTLVESGPNLLPAEDRDLVLPLRDRLRAEGVALHENTRILSAEAASQGVALLLEGGARLSGSHLLLALGRAPRLQPLDLLAAGIEASAIGVVTGGDLRVQGNRRVWAAGSIAAPAGLPQHRFAPSADAHAGLILRAMQGRHEQLDPAPLPRLVRTDPALLQIGLNEAEARAQNLSPRVLRAEAEGSSAKLLVDAGGHLLGAGLLGPGAEAAGPLLGLAIARRLPVSALVELPLLGAPLAESIRAAAMPYYTPLPRSPMLRRILGLLQGRS